MKADRHYPSSQLCHDCGWRSGKLSLSVREWVCRGCGDVRDRDANAALNLRDYSPERPGECLWTSRTPALELAVAV